MVEEEQQGADRAKYGAKILDSLSSYLTEEYGRGFSRSNLAGMRKFYLVYRDRDEAIVQSQIGQLGAMQESGIVQLPQIYHLLEQYGEGKEIHIFHSREDAENYLSSQCFCEGSHEKTGKA